MPFPARGSNASPWSNTDVPAMWPGTTHPYEFPPGRICGADPGVHGIGGRPPRPCKMTKTSWDLAASL